jgi:hypothetical protein
MGAGIGRVALVGSPGGGVRWPLWLVVGCSLAAALAANGASATARSLSGATPAVRAQPTAVAVQLAAPARAVHGSDGHEHIEYDLVITNAFTAPVTLKSVLVHGAGELLLSLTGKGLKGHTFAPWESATPTVTIPRSSTVETVVDVVLPDSFGRTWPKLLTERIRYALPSNAPLRAVIGSTVVPGPTVPVSREAPIMISSPLAGPGWVDSNGCCADPTNSHRSDLLAADGTYHTPEVFAIDWIRETNGSYFTGDGTKLNDWPAYGAPIHAVADGIVVTAVNDRRQVAPLVSPGANPDVEGPDDFPGNNVVEKIASGEYAFYAHMQTGSVRVKVGEHLRTGEVIGLLGNSGNTTAPHLHFGIQDGPTPLTSNSLPFEIDWFTNEGTVGEGAAPGTITVSGERRAVTHSEPLVYDLADFPG